MSKRRLLQLCVPVLLSLPLAAQAEWPDGARDAYIKDCVSNVSIDMDISMAEQRCECTANEIGENFTSAEIETLNSKGTMPPALLRERLSQVVSICSQPD